MAILSALSWAFLGVIYAILWGWRRGSFWVWGLASVGLILFCAFIS